MVIPIPVKQILYVVIYEIIIFEALDHLPHFTNIPIWVSLISLFGILECTSDQLIEHIIFFILGSWDFFI